MLQVEGARMLGGVGGHTPGSSWQVSGGEEACFLLCLPQHPEHSRTAARETLARGDGVRRTKGNARRTDHEVAFTA